MLIIDGDVKVNLLLIKFVNTNLKKIPKSSAIYKYSLMMTAAKIMIMICLSSY